MSPPAKPEKLPPGSLQEDCAIRRYSRYDRRGPRFDPNEPRVNDRIRKSPVRLIDADGEQLGIVPIEDARRRAKEKGLDLVEVGANADPPVVRILDWGKMRYERQKREKESKKKATVIEVKEVKYRPTIDDHDFDIKTARARRFLSKGNKVKVTVFFRYRQMRRPELGFEILDKVSKELADIAEVESRSRMEGRQMVMIMAPLAEALKAIEKEKIAKKAELTEKKAEPADKKAEPADKKAEPADKKSEPDEEKADPAEKKTES